VIYFFFMNWSGGRGAERSGGKREREEEVEVEKDR
jgi:hypothetical protein